MTKRRDSLVRPEDLGRGPDQEKRWTPSEGTSPMIGARVDPQMREDLERIASKEGVTMSDIIRWLIARFIADYEAGKVDLPKRRREDAAPYTLDY